MGKKQFIRYCEVNLPNAKITSDNLEIHFDIPFDKDTEPNESSIVIYNLSETTRNAIKPKQKVTVNAGYKGDIGEVLNGHVSHIKTERSGTDRATTIYILDAKAVDSKEIEAKTFKKGTKALQIVNELAPKLGLPIGEIALPKNVTYKEGYSADGPIVEVLSAIAADCGASFYVNKGKLFMRSIQVGQNDAAVVLNSETGLIGSPEEFIDNEGFKGYYVKCLLQHRITIGTIVKIKSKYVNGSFRVRDGEHHKSDSDFITEMEVI